MSLNFKLLLLLCSLAIGGRAQDGQAPSLNIGGPAPPIRVRAWIKGTPIQRFETGRVYVVEFWATWCKPCIAGMPHLSALASKYSDKATFLGVDVYERKTTSIRNVKAFVDSIGRKMEYHVAVEDSDFMVIDWLNAAGAQSEGIPRCFVVNGKGKVAWIGGLHDLDMVLAKIVNGKWNLKQALAIRKSQKYFDQLDAEEEFTLARFRPNPLDSADLGKQDSIISVIKQLVKEYPELKYMPITAQNTFSALLRTSPHKAYEYGERMIAASTYENDLYYLIYSNIQVYSVKLSLSAEIYRLGIEAYQAEIKTFRETTDLPEDYDKIAEWYWRIGDGPKASEAEQMAILTLKNGKGISKTDNMADFEARLRKYKGM